MGDDPRRAQGAPRHDARVQEMRRRSAARFWLAGLAALLLIGCATRPTTTSTHTWVRPCDDCVPGLRNFGKVNDRLWRAAQPDTQDVEVFRKLQQAGVKSVINLRHDHDDFPALIPRTSPTCTFPCVPGGRTTSRWCFSSRASGARLRTRNARRYSFIARKGRTAP